jgi:hypothetical protein
MFDEIFSSYQIPDDEDRNGPRNVGLFKDTWNG